MMRRIAAPSLFVIYVFAWIPGLVYDPQSFEPVGMADIMWAVSFLAFSLTGLFFAWRGLATPMGWLLLAGAAFAGAGVSLNEFGEARAVQWAMDVSDVAFVGGLVALTSAFTLFPDGKYPNRLVRWVHVVGLITFATGLFTSTAVLELAPVITLGSTVMSLIQRLWRGNGLQRRQIAAPFIPIVVGLSALLVFTVAGIEDSGNGVVGELPVLAFIVISVGAPVGVLLAVTRYRLYEIDRIVSRTVSYALIVVLLGGFFLTAVVVIPNQIMSGEAPAWLVATTTLATAALFNPLRRRIQGVVDRRFNRSRFDAARVMDEFAERLRGLVGGDELVAGWSDVAIETMQPSVIGVWVR